MSVASTAAPAADAPVPGEEARPVDVSRRQPLLRLFALIAYMAQNGLPLIAETPE